MAMRIDNVVIVVPNGRWSGVRDFNIHPYSAALLAAVIRDRWQVTIVDANTDDLSLDQVLAQVLKVSPEVVGISAMSIEYAKSCHQMAAVIKQRSPEMVVIVGGAYPTVLPEVAIRDTNVDYAVLSEGERRLPLLLQALAYGDDPSCLDGVACRVNGQDVINPAVEFIENLDDVPFPAYDLVDFKKNSVRHNKYSLYNNPRFMPYGVTISSRGCPFKCVFCSSKHIHGRTCRMRSAENVLKEIDWLVGTYGIRELIFLDDNLLLDRNRMIRIMHGLIERRYDLHWKATNVPTFRLDDEILNLMKNSGCYQVTLPIESGNEHVLNHIIHKPLDLEQARRVISRAKEMDFEVACLFVIGLPGETWDQILDTVRFAEEIDVDWVVFSIASPLPKTELYDIAREQELLEPGFNFSDFQFFGFGRGTITTNEFTPAELQMLRAMEWDRINFKTTRKKERIAMMNGISLKELEEWRRETRRSAGRQVALLTKGGLK